MFITLACSIKDSELFNKIQDTCTKVFGWGSSAWRVENGQIKVYYKDIMAVERHINQFDLGV